MRICMHVTVLFAPPLRSSGRCRARSRRCELTPRGVPARAAMTPAPARPVLAPAARFAAVVLIAALCLWLDHTSKMLALEPQRNYYMLLPRHWYWPLQAIGLLCLTALVAVSSAWCSTIGVGLATGGVLGNGMDWRDGYVVDWIPVRPTHCWQFRRHRAHRGLRSPHPPRRSPARRPPDRPLGPAPTVLMPAVLHSRSRPPPSR